jgi:hypothetical protein
VIRSYPAHLKSVTITLLCTLVLSLITQTSSAQVTTELPRSTIEAISISSSQQSQITEFVDAWSQRALSDNTEDNKKAIEALTKPFAGRVATVAFRQSYTSALNPLLTSLKDKGSVGASISMLRIAGYLATPSALNMIKDELDSDDMGVQLFAVSRVGQVFTSTINFGPAISESNANSLIQSVETIGSQNDINDELVRACVRSLSIGTRLSTDDIGNARSSSIIALANIVGSRLRSLSVTDDPSFAQSLALDAASAATSSISAIRANKTYTTPDAVRAAVGLGGDVISVALRREIGKTLKPISNRDLTINSVQSGESLLYFALLEHAENNNKPAQGIRQTSFADQLREGKDKEFRNGASLLLADGSYIVTEFKFNGKRFLN